MMILESFMNNGKHNKISDMEIQKTTIDLRYFPKIINSLLHIMNFMNKDQKQ